jgi:hypothetical protein
MLRASTFVRTSGLPKVPLPATVDTLPPESIMRTNGWLPQSEKKIRPAASVAIALGVSSIDELREPSPGVVVEAMDQTVGRGVMRLEMSTPAVEHVVPRAVGRRHEALCCGIEPARAQVAHVRA